MRHILMMLAVNLVFVAGCSGASDTTTPSPSTTTTSVLQTTAAVPLASTTTTTTTTAGTCGTARLVFRVWSIDGNTTQAVEALPFDGYQSEFLSVEDSTTEIGVRFFLRADERFDAGGSPALEAAKELFARGQTLPSEAVFSGYSTRWVELWWDPENLDAVFMVPRAQSGFIETEKWPAIPFGGHCH